jgi:hypothetical protein
MIRKKRRKGENEHDKDKNKPKLQDEETLETLRKRWHTHAVMESGRYNSCKYCGELCDSQKDIINHLDNEHWWLFEEYRKI